MERPIIFSGPMVRAIMDGQKTQTRRVIDPQPRDVIADHGIHDGMWGYLQQTGLALDDHDEHWIKCPYGVPGDRLWVREAWAAADVMYHQHAIDPPRVIGYFADLSALDFVTSPPTPKGPLDLASWNWDVLRKRPSIHMPRWASRLTLEVVSVRVERLQEISESDAQAEGVDATPEAPAQLTRRGAFCGLWDTINGKRAPWSSNPWVWVVEFRRTEP